MYKVEDIRARQIFDARGNPTTEVEIKINGKALAYASTPAGASVGSCEAKELRDGGKRYMGKGVSTAIDKINSQIKPKLLNESFANQEELDSFLISLDGSKDKSNLGSNSILPISIAFSKALAICQNVPLFRSIASEICNEAKVQLPRPMLNIINGGQHADNRLDIQEFMIVPQAEGILENLRIAQEVSQHLKAILKKHGHSVNVGDEGGFAPNIKSHTEALDLLLEAASSANHDKEVRIALDVAASELYKDGLYSIEGEVFKPDEMVQYYAEVISKYPEIISIEDPFSEYDEEGWKKGTQELPLQLVGDDLFVTNVEKLQLGIKNGYGNAIIIKPNQIGTVSESIKAVSLAKKNGYKIIISHRSGDTEDNFISHLAVATNADYIKAGALCRGERVCKYNELIRINEII